MNYKLAHTQTQTAHVLTVLRWTLKSELLSYLVPETMFIASYHDKHVRQCKEVRSTRGIQELVEHRKNKGLR